MEINPPKVEISHIKGKLRRQPQDYKRTNYDTVPTYDRYMEYFIKKMSNNPSDVLGRVKAINKQNAIDPVVLYFNKDRETYDTHSDTISLSEYHKRTIRENNTMSGSGTTYVPKEVEESVPSKMMNVNKIQRSIAKAKAFQAKSEKDMTGFAIFNREQINKKLSNNSLSGIVGILSSFLYCPSLHPTLTSTTRLTTSIANTVIERLLGSNRNYHSFEYTIQDVISVCCDANDRADDIWAVVERYSLYIPTANDMVDVIMDSAKDYWIDRAKVKEIVKFVNTLTDLERIAYCYTGDIWFLVKHNDAVMREFFKDLIDKEIDVKEHQAEDIANTYDEYQKSLAAHFLSEDLNSKGNNYHTMDRNLLHKITKKIEYVSGKLEYHMALFRTFLSTEHLPPNVSDVKTMLRKSVPMSDTDSVAMWLGRFMKWYTGSDTITNDSYSVLGVMSYMSVLSVDHSLRLLSYNMGLSGKDADILEMKSEYTWTALCFVNITKHYYASTTVIEANVLEEMEIETKGVHLKSSSLPQFIVDGAEDLKKYILDGVTGGDKSLSLTYIIDTICGVEDYIENMILNADTSVLKLMQIKEATSYANPDPARNNSKHYHFWQDVFSKKYGYDVTIPYTAVKFKLKFRNKTAWIAYLSSIEDEKIREAMIMYVRDYMAADYPEIFYIPLEYASNKGIPLELVEAIDIDAIILDLCNIYYIILTSLGYVLKHGSTLREVIRSKDK